MNEKIQFLTNPDDGLLYICLVSKDDDSKITYNYKKIGEDEKLPSEYFESKEYDKALNGYLAIQKVDSLSPIIEEELINKKGYDNIREKKYDIAVQIFAINVALYPNSSNVYDSYGEALFHTGDTLAAIANFKKSLSMDSGNRNAKRYLKKLESN
jgi:tetratricopeptide (TPR) repeat protein